MSANDPSPRKRVEETRRVLDRAGDTIHAANPNGDLAEIAGNAQEIRRVGRVIEEALSGSPLPEPSPDLRQLVELRLSAVDAGPALRPVGTLAVRQAPTGRWLRWAAVAATIFVACGSIIALLLPAVSADREAARRSAAAHAARWATYDSSLKSLDQRDLSGGTYSEPPAATLSGESYTDPESGETYTDPTKMMIPERMQGEPYIEAVTKRTQPGKPADSAERIPAATSNPGGQPSNRFAVSDGSVTSSISTGKPDGRGGVPGMMRGGGGLSSGLHDQSGGGQGGMQGRVVEGNVNDSDTLYGNRFTVSKPTYESKSQVDTSNEAYDSLPLNPWSAVTDHPLSTFSIDVDTASYANVRRYIESGSLPPAEAVRLEEMVNDFRYDDAPPDGEHPFSVTAEVAACPWTPGHRLLRIGLAGKAVNAEQRPASNLVFLIDVSGSMDEPNKLPLVKASLAMLVEQLTDADRVAIVVYAGQSGLVLPSATGANRRQIHAAIDRLTAGGSTNGGAGIQQAYEQALTNFIDGGNNRVILATDGDFNVGITDRDQLVRMVQEQAKSRVFLSTLGFGVGNLKDAMLEKLADCGNGNYSYIDTLSEGRKVLVEEMAGTILTIAKDVKIQIEFNPACVSHYRLLGYENRILADRDFNDDTKDAGEIGAGHHVTALFEIMPPGAVLGGTTEPLKYQGTKSDPPDRELVGELGTIKLRYKAPEGDTSRLLEHIVADSNRGYGMASQDFKFATAVAGFAMLLRSPQSVPGLSYEAVIELAQDGMGNDRDGYRYEFLELVTKARRLAHGQP